MSNEPAQMARTFVKSYSSLRPSSDISNFGMEYECLKDRVEARMRGRGTAQTESEAKQNTEKRYPEKLGKGPRVITRTQEEQ